MAKLPVLSKWPVVRQVRAGDAGTPAPSLVDAQGRAISYLRVALTDRCNFRCSYCSPAAYEAAIDRMLALDAKGFYEVVRQRRMTMCGVIPTTVALLACQELGAATATLVRYMTSADISGDLDTVVGYAGLLIT